ncbi:MAG TPA: FUSC family membrane protein, partial [Chitinophagaceae bacterium]
MQQRANEIKYFFYSQAFADGFRTSFAILFPALCGQYFNFFSEGLTISLGCLCVSLTDAPGPVVHKKNGMLFSTAFSFLIAIITGFARLNVYTLGLEIIVASFFFSMFNVYGNRAASVGSSGILMMILTMDVSLTPAQILPHSLLILVGGVFYTLLSLSLHAIRPYRISQRVLGDCIR